MQRPIAVAAFFFAAAIAPAHAQQDDNQAWVDQIGETNAITITQIGNRNFAGADADELLIDQQGANNTMLIHQYGYDNAVGTLPREELLAVDDDLPWGINQYGDRNMLELRQANSAEGDRNLIGAVLQWSSGDNASWIANRLYVVQSDAGALGAAGHRVDGIRQVNSLLNSTANSIRISQSGGGTGIGNGYLLANQHGSGNHLETEQSGNSNSIGESWQQGIANEIRVRQSEGAGNEILRIRQLGEENAARVTQSGSQNYLELLLQNNDGVVTAGNTAIIVQAGDGNGSNGAGGGGLGAFRAGSAADGMGLGQATISQLGDDNSVSYMVGGDLNLFAFWQDGTGNGILGVVGDADLHAGGNSNEQAVWQQGDDNELSYRVYGTDNDFGVRLVGNRNLAKVDQSGSRNTAAISINGDDNNGDVQLLGAAQLTQGALFGASVLQHGLDNAAHVQVDGDNNAFAVNQLGNGNAASVQITGSFNEAVIVQSGASNSADIRQNGLSNYAGINQV